ncbi:hypothetical protein BDR22DRAFT_810384, partial [Usnea florida]
GTWTILYNCCFTLSLCVVTAIHLNVGPAGETTLQWLRRKCKWVIIAILTPEIMLYTAGKQWFSASRLCKKLNKLATKYSLMYGYFGLMGGFVFDVSAIHNTLSRLTISAKGLAFLAKHGHFVKISDAAIRDKSKADMLVKSLVCIQVSWMLVQTISRKSVGYPITLLEVHTLVHVGSAIGMYGLWFQKPLDVRDPAWVDASEFEDLLALMLLYRDSPKGSVNYFTYYNHSIFLDRKGLQAGFYAYFCSWASGGLIAALSVCMFYGAAHATAWDFVFPTPVERLLWRIACIDTIAGVISLLAIFSVVVFYHEHGFRLLWKSFFTREPGVLPLLYRLVILIGLLNAPFFVLSRIYIITETFISLRRAQLGIYQTVQWTDYIPHY